MSGVMKSETSAATTAPNAAPMTMPIARSTTLPRRMKLRNPLSMGVLPPPDAGRRRLRQIAGVRRSARYGDPLSRRAQRLLEHLAPGVARQRRVEHPHEL